MKKVIITVLVVILLVLTVLVAGAIGFIWYRDNHVFVEDAVYPIDSVSLDLRQEDISLAHYNELHAKLPNCEILWMVPFQGGEYSSDSDALRIKSLTREDMEMLSYFPELKEITAEFDDYAILEELKAVRPDLTVAYQVSIGETSYAPDVTELVLENGDYELETLTENLIFLPEVKTITLKKTDLTLEQIDALRAAYEDIAIRCTVELLGQEYDMETTQLDLSAMTSGDVEAVSEKLAMLPNLTAIELMDAQGTSQLTKADVKALQEAAPGVVFNYSFEFYGLTLSTAEEEVHIKNTKIGDEGESEIRLALDLMPNCKRFVLENCQVSNEVLAKIRDDYREQTKVVWRVWFGEGTSMTDAEIIRAVYDLVDDNCHDLIYCEDVRFIDFGHNEWLDTCDFVAGMPNLEAIILSGSPIKDLTPFQNCKKLKFLEIAFCEYIEDLSPLAGCESLEMLNISNTHALDLSPLDDLPLTLMCARLNPSGRSRIPLEEQARFIEQHPDCWTSFEGAQPYGAGWRYTEDEKDYLEYYAMLRDIFRYNLDPNIPNHVGWYISEEHKAQYSLG